MQLSLFGNKWGIYLTPLFLPVNSDVYTWYEKDAKEWEVRRSGIINGRKSPWNEQTIIKNREIRIHRGYSGSDEILGTISSDPLIGTLDDILQNININYKEIIPTATSEEEAMNIILKTLKSSKEDKYIAFKIVKNK